MQTVKTIKDVNDETWYEFKSMAIKNKLKVGEFFEKMVSEYKEKSKNIWDEILIHDKILSDKEAKELEDFVKVLRKEKGYRP